MLVFAAERLVQPLAGWLAQQLRADGVEHLHTHFISTPADVAELAAHTALASVLLNLDEFITRE